MPGSDRSSPESEVGRALRRLGVDEHLIATAIHLLPGEAVAALAYGSRARGDHKETSDLDMLTLVDVPCGSRSLGGVNVSCYTVDQLSDARGTLFGMHLRRDGVVLWDPGVLLRPLLATLCDPDPSRLFARLRDLAVMLDVPPCDQTRYASGLARVARYFLRTAIYVQALAAGQPCFSVRELAARHSEPELVALLSSDPAQQGPVDAALVRDLTARLAAVVGPLPANQLGSLRALVVGDWYEHPERAALATLALAGHGQEFDYARLPKVLL